MTSQGSAHGRFTRAIQRRNLFEAERAARRMRGLSLPDALELVILMAAVRPDRLERAAIRWHGRLEVEASTLTLAESRFALAALERLPADPQAADMLRRLASEGESDDAPIDPVAPNCGRDARAQPIRRVRPRTFGWVWSSGAIGSFRVGRR
jgi:hypothetical protein